MCIVSVGGGGGGSQVYLRCSDMKVAIHIECPLYYGVQPFSLSQVSCKHPSSGRCHDGRTGC